MPESKESTVDVVDTPKKRKVNPIRVTLTVLVLYVMSFGPVFAWLENEYGWMSIEAEAFVQSFYYPLMMAALLFPPLAAFLRVYVDFCDSFL